MLWSLATCNIYGWSAILMPWAMLVTPSSVMAWMPFMACWDSATWALSILPAFFHSLNIGL